MTENMGRLCEERGDEALQGPARDSGLLRFARKGGETATAPVSARAKPLRSVADLAARGLIAAEQAQALHAVEKRYSVAVPAEIAALIDSADPNDPIAKQFVPDPRELVTTPEERADPIGDDAHSPTPGLVHRYPDRVLLKLLAACPVYCRFCFRRESVGRGQGALSQEALEATLAYVASRPEIFEVILTGGDPLALPARKLGALSSRLAQIAHVQILRVHTRAPVVAPQLASSERLAALRASGKTVYLVLHVNHPRELTPSALDAIARIIDAGIPALAQTVLLQGVNDDANILERLMRALVRARVTPYYLHHPDLAPGTAHFRLPLAVGQALHAELARRLPGFALPAYVLDIPGGFGKVSAARANVGQEADGRWRVIDPNGRTHSYRG